MQEEEGAAGSRGAANAVVFVTRDSASNQLLALGISISDLNLAFNRWTGSKRHPFNISVLES
jgi:hypothetical protein